MTWTPTFEFLSIAPFRANIRAAIEDKIEAALAWAAPGVELPPFAGIYASRAVRDEYPVLNLLALGGDPLPTDGGDYVENKRLLLEVETINTDGEDLVETLECYVRAVRSIVTEMTEEELTANIDTRSRERIMVTVGSERYGEREVESENSYLQVGSVIATISYLELERVV